MNIPAHFEFHYVENNVKKSVTLLTAMLFKHPHCSPAPGLPDKATKIDRQALQQRPAASAQVRSATAVCT